MNFFRELKNRGEMQMQELLRRSTELVFLLVLGLVLISGCVRQHPDRVASVNEVYAVPGLNPTPTGAKTDEGETPKVLAKATYFVQDDHLGCTETDAEVGSLSEDGRPVVTLSTGEKAACVRPSSVARLKSRPEVTLYNGLNSSPFKIYTKQVVRSSGRTQSPTGVKTEGDIGIKVLDVVDYTTTSPLLNAIKDRIDLRAEPFSEYDVYHKITPTHILVMKVGLKSELSHLDLPIADNLGNGRYAVPIASAPLSLHNYRAIRNADGEKTNVYEFHPVEDFEIATHVMFNIADFQEVDLPERLAQDLYPADYFVDGRWYVSESVVETRPGREGFIGTTTGSFDMDLRSASKVQFTRTSSALVACNIGIDERFENDPDCLESATVVTIPARGHAYSMNSMSDAVMEERLLPKEAPFLRLDFENNMSTRKSIDTLLSVFGLLGTRQDQLQELSFAEDRFSFVVERGETGLMVRYSFLRADNRPGYEPRRHFKDDRQNRFGFFVETKARIRGSEDINQEEDLEKDYLAQRHNPTQDIFFHFSNLTPDYANEDDPYDTNIDYREIGRKAVDYWNAAFERANAPNRIVLVEDQNGGRAKDAPFGDIAFNTINLIDSERGSNLLGVGPSLVDPYTGEIINTNANVYIAPFREIVASKVRAYIRSKLGYYDGPAVNLTDENKQNSSLLGDFTSSSSGALDVFSQLLPKRLLTMAANFYHRGFDSFNSQEPTNGNLSFANNGDEVANLFRLRGFNTENAKVKFLKEMAPRVPELQYLAEQGKVVLNPSSRSELLELEDAFETHRPAFYRSYMMSEQASGFNEFDSLTREIQTKCGEVNSLIARVQGRTPKGSLPSLTTAEELPALKDCMFHIIPDKFMATLVHEMGHNLGLRHNFFGSTDGSTREGEDAGNFMTRPEVKEIYGLDIAQEDLPRSSSVMEYIATEQDRLFFPGHYDIAAIRYGYADQVELKSGATRPNSPQGNYVTLTKTNDFGGGILNEVDKDDLVNFKYCTDVQASLAIDPMCDRHDFGATPKVSVDNVINRFWESFIQFNFKYDRISPGTTGPFVRSMRLGKLKRIYDEWRVELRNYLGRTDSTGNTYLQRYSLAEYTELIDELKSNENFSGAQYLEVRDQIFDFFMEIAFFPNHYCFVVTPIGPKAMEFSRLKEEARNLLPPEGARAANCEDEYIQQVIASKGFNYLFEAGISVDNLWYEINPVDTFEEDVNFIGNRSNLDVVGTFLDRFMASGMFASRQSGFVGLFQRMFPSMLDEPDLYARFEQALLSRILNGADLTKAVETPGLFDFPEGQAFILPNFEAESSLLKAMWMSLEDSVSNPFVDTADKASRFTRLFTDDLNQIQAVQQQGGIAIPLTSGRTVLVLPQWEVSFALASRYMQLNQQIRASELSIPEAQQLAQSLDPLADAGAQIMTPVDSADAQTLQSLRSIEVDQYIEFSRLFLNVANQIDDFQFTLFRALYLEDILLYLVELSDVDQRIQSVQNQNLVPHPEDIAKRDAVIARWRQVGIRTAAQQLQDQLNQARVAITSSFQGQGGQMPPEFVAQVSQQLRGLLGGSVPTPWVDALTELFLQANAQVVVNIPTSESLLAKKPIALQIANLIVSQANMQKQEAEQLFEIDGDEIFAQRDLIRAILLYDFAEIDEDIALGLVELLGDKLELSAHPSYDYVRRELSDAKVLQSYYKIPVSFPEIL